MQDWLKNGWLKKHQTTAQEIGELLELADRDLKDCRARGLSDDWKLNIAYNAALQAGFAALHAAGYAVPKGDSHHFRVIQSLEYTVELNDAAIAKLDTYRKKRNMGIYDIAGAISGRDADDCVATAADLLARVRAWLAKEHPDLLI
ncbi:MAG: hypothetical protein SGJ19_26020 [Planctomycetia bacterium]|nr:hypothetical protein [Planctomycetia bacterium]